MQEDDRLAGFPAVERAPAKVNLALHVVGQRKDGYHLLDSLVTFTAYGDRIGLSPAVSDHFTLSGRFADALCEEAGTGGNLVLRARDGLRALLLRLGRPAPPVHIHLEKNLPVASGIGGGSADAAATLRGLSKLWGVTPPPGALRELALGLGADVPMCLARHPLVARGIGEDIRPFPLPALPMVLANPLVAIATPAVFGMLATKDNPPLVLPADDPAGVDWVAALAALRNDLEPPARAICPEIGRISETLAESGAALVRMSGSGATCFALYPSHEAARAAAAALAQRHPDWFIIATRTTEGAAHGTH